MCFVNSKQTVKVLEDVKAFFSKIVFKWDVFI